MAARLARHLVSQNKKRFTQDGFDLDLVYLTDEIICMGLPAEGKEAFYRNPIDVLVRFFESRHAGAAAARRLRVVVAAPAAAHAAASPPFAPPRRRVQDLQPVQRALLRHLEVRRRVRHLRLRGPRCDDAIRRRRATAAAAETAAADALLLLSGAVSYTHLTLPTKA